jgi:hypothetical protein
MCFLALMSCYSAGQRVEKQVFGVLARAGRNAVVIELCSEVSQRGGRITCHCDLLMDSSLHVKTYASRAQR